MKAEKHFLEIDVFRYDRELIHSSLHVLVEGIDFLVECGLMRAGENPYLMYPINDHAAERLEHLGVLVDRKRFKYQLTARPAPQEWHGIIE